MAGANDAEAVGAWLQTLWPPGDQERVALESLANSSGTDESSEPVLESVVSEDVDLSFTQSGVTVRTADGQVSASKATPHPFDEPPRRRSKAPFILAGAALFGIAGGVIVASRHDDAPPAPVPPPVVVVAPPAPPPEPEKVPVPEPEAEPEPQPKTPAAKGGGWLELATTPPVNVYVKGRSLGRTPMKVPLPAGKVSVRLADAAAGIERTLPLVIRSGNTTTSSITFAKGKLDLRVSPWAQVKLDGKSLGNTPIPVQELFEGTHQLELTNPEIPKSKKLEVRIAGGETKLVRETLE
jgi:serine/threonine-protein kinase